jgi:hypothetical protein
MPFEPFERYSPYGNPQQIAEFLSPYIDAGCSAFNVIPCAADDESAIAGVSDLRTLLAGSRLNSEGPPEIQGLHHRRTAHAINF